MRKHLKERYCIHLVHALKPDSLRAPEATFSGMWRDIILWVVTQVKEIDTANAEAKSMRTSEPFLRKVLQVVCLNV